jgi:hypothetical protein
MLACFVPFHPLIQPPAAYYFAAAHRQVGEGRHTWNFAAQGSLNMRLRTSQQFRNVLNRQVLVWVFHTALNMYASAEAFRDNFCKIFLVSRVAVNLIGILGALVLGGSPKRPFG